MNEGRRQKAGGSISQTCPQCGYKKKKELSQRVHSCDNCDFVADRDVAQLW
ncbi:zinc ribbon domain-containing protein [Fischerella thermalis]|uniref:zinc ribbon domain-containing protein n=1 Tax=Fischerella thermalis TaxID=372787 RepID=UPI00190FAF34|nr:zinc ribbon domain-containing protein [Fischerella thermalis]